MVNMKETSLTRSQKRTYITLIVRILLFRQKMKRNHNKSNSPEIWHWQCCSCLHWWWYVVRKRQLSRYGRILKQHTIIYNFDALIWIDSKMKKIFFGSNGV